MDLRVSDIKLDSLPTMEPKKETQVTEDFNFTLNKIENNNLMEKLNGLIDEITTQGKKYLTIWI